MNSRLKRLREAQGLSAKELSEKIKIPLTTYREWEYGRAITGEPYPKLAEVLNVSLHELMTGKKPDKINVLQDIEELEKRLGILRKNLQSFF